MKQRTLAMMNGIERYSKKTRRALFLEEMEQVVPWGKLCSLIEPYYPKAGNGRPAVGVDRMLAALLFAAVVQPVGSGGGRSVVRLGGAAAVCGHRPGARAGAGRDHGVQVPSSAGRTPVGRANAGSGQPAPAEPGGTDHDGHDRGCDDYPCAEFDQESRAETRSRDAPDEEGQAVVLRHEGARGGGQQDQA